jgi:hypothetical protein
MIMALIDSTGKWIQSVSWKQWLCLYMGIALVMFIYLFVDRQKKIRDRTLYLASSANSKRAKAIEQFQSYNSQLATELNQQCDASTAGGGDEPEPTRQGLFINPGVRPAVMAMASVGTQTGFNDAQVLLENYLYRADSQIADFVSRTRDDLAVIIQESNRNNAYAQELKLDALLDDLPDRIKKLITELDTGFQQSLTDSQVGLFKTLTEDERANKHHQLDVETRERLFETFAGDKRKLFRQLCQQRTRVKDAQATYDTTQTGQDTLDRLNMELKDLDAKYKAYLFILSRVATTSAAIETLKKEMQAVSTLLIQPANESQIDAISMIKQKTANQAAVDGIGNPITNRKAEADLARKFSGAYQDYLDSMEKNSLKLDPIQVLSNTETRVIDFLTRLNGSPPSTVPTGSRFGNQTNNLGDYLRSPVPTDANLTQGAPLTDNAIKQVGDSMEGFEDITAPPPTLASVDGFIKYAYDTVTGFLDKKTADRLTAMFQGEENMIPMGVLLIIGSVILFLAQSGDE